MATSESDDFESADEELNVNKRQQYWPSSNTVGSESDDDTEFVPRVPCKHPTYDNARNKRSTSEENVTSSEKKNVIPPNQQDDKLSEEKSKESTTVFNSEEIKAAKDCNQNPSLYDEIAHATKTIDNPITEQPVSNSKNQMKEPRGTDKSSRGKREKNHQQKTKEPQQTGGSKKLGTRIIKDDAKLKNLSQTQENNKPLEEDEWIEMDMPAELKSNKKFKEIFKPQGWENVGDDVELPEELIKETPKVTDALPSVTEATVDNISSGGNTWGGWGNWGVSSLISTATAGVSTLTSHVTHGLTLLEETIGVPPDATDLPQIESKEKDDLSPSPSEDNSIKETEQTQSQMSFGFGNLISGVSSITKLVESTGTKVMTGGLDTLEAIGKKTMEVLQEGDPGLKKKRAFFINEIEKPILSKILREAKERADAEEKSIEEKQMARKVHFESLFDDFQGLVHLEALEMLSKQCNIRIHQRLNDLNIEDTVSIKETLEEVKELCDLGEEDEEEDEVGDLKSLLDGACKDIGINVTFEKLHQIWEESKSSLDSASERSDQEIFESAVSTLAQFTALSVERFHKIAELLLIKERRSTVNEADALVQLTRILSNQTGFLATSYCNSLNERAKSSPNSDDISSNITTIFMEASNSGSYIQDAFRLLIPILQVGAI